MFLADVRDERARGAVECLALGRVLAVFDATGDFHASPAYGWLMSIFCPCFQAPRRMRVPETLAASIPETLAG